MNSINKYCPIIMVSKIIIIIIGLLKVSGNIARWRIVIDLKIECIYFYKQNCNIVPFQQDIWA